MSKKRVEVNLNMERKMHMETINKVKKFINEKDYEGLKLYIEKREIELRECAEENKSSDYIDSLVNDLT